MPPTPSNCPWRSARGTVELELSATAELASAELNLHRFAQGVTRIEARLNGVVGSTPAERKLLAVAAFASAQQNAPAAKTRDLTARALGEGSLVAEQSCASMIVMEALFALVLSDGDELLDRELEGAIGDARGRGWPIGFALAVTIRAWLHMRRGDLGAAQRDLESVVDVRALHGPTPLDPFVTAFEAWIVAERTDDPAVGLARLPAEAIPDAAVFQLMLLARGELRLRAGDRGGVDDVLEVGARELRYGGVTPAAMAWRSTAAAATGDPALAREELELATALESDRAIGIALRGLGLATDDPDPLERSVTHLRRSTARLELARSLVEFGTALRRGRRLREARPPLREAMDLARACGAVALARRAEDELGASGERHSAAGELTASELRVARMAAAGRANREIADALGVTQRTVEVHLTRSYRKLGLRNRRGLTEALGDQSGGLAP